MTAAAPVAAGEAAILTAPVRFGRRKNDPAGHLQLTSGSLTFLADQALSVGWARISAVAHVDCDVIFSLCDSHRVLRFCCQTTHEAARLLVVARHFSIGSTEAQSSHTPAAARA